MSELAIARKERLARIVRGMDNAVCVAVFIGASMPAIVVMLIIAFPLLPLFGVWVSWVATTGGPTATEDSVEHPQDHAGRTDQPHGHTPATPRFA